MASAPILNHVHTLGLNPEVLSNLHFVDENVVLYPAGHSVVIYNVEKKTQRFILGSEGSRITTLALSPNRRFVAIAETSDRATITIFDVQTLRKRKVIMSGQIMQYLWMSFSPDGKLLLTLGAAPDYLLTNWMWEKIRPLHSVKSASGAGIDDVTSMPISNSTQPVSPVMHQCSFSSYDPTLVVVIGYGRISLYRLSTTMQFEPIANDFKDISQHDFVSHAWIKDSLVLGTRAGIVFVCGPLGSTFIQKINLNTIKMESVTAHHQPDAEVPGNSASGASALCLSGFNHGLVCGSRNGVVFLFDLQSEGEQSTLLGTCKRLHVRQSTTSDVQNIALNPSEQLLAVTTSTPRAYFLSLANTDILKPGEIKFESLLESFHSGPILGMDICIRKPLIVTCGADCTVRVWNYLDRVMECVKLFTEQCRSVAIHPSGFQLVIGFTDKLRLMNLLMDDVRPCKEINVKNCREVQFSTGGHMFAAVHGSMIVVNTFHEDVTVCSVLISSTRVSSIQWTHDDQIIITSGSDGALYEFSARSGQREREYVQKGCKYFQAVASHDGKIYAVGSDLVLKEIADSSVQKEVDAGTVLTQIILSHPVERMLFAGTEKGQIRSFKFPLTGHCQDYQCHSAAVNRLRLSRDDTVLFSAGADGCLAVFDVREQEGRSATATQQMPWSEEVLVTRSDLEERATLTNDMKNKVDELTLHNEYQSRLQEMSHNDKLKEIKESCQVTLENQKKIYDQVKDAKQDMEMEYEEAVKKLEEIQVATLSLAKQEHQDQIMKEVEAYHELELDMKREEEEWNRQMHVTDEQHQDALDARQSELEEMLQHEKERVERLLEEKDAILREFKETKRQLEQDTDVEIQELKEKFDQQLASERETTLRLKGENGIMKKRFSSLSNDIEDQKEELKVMSEKEQAVRDQISLLYQEIDRNKYEINALDATIGDKERTIYELKKKNQEMEKYKFVLDYQIKELKREIEPHECKISEMQEQEEKMDEKLERLHSDNGDLKHAVDDLKRQTNGVQSSINEARHQGQQLCAQFQRQIFELDHVVHVDDDKVMEGVAELVAKYVQADTTTVDREPEIEAEYDKQTAYLRREIDRLKRSVENDGKRRSRETHRIMEQNSELIKEINSLRKQIR